ncbi:phospholipase C [Mycobacterium shinjukuense]|uniref:phospholipase C n=1 Tax=Mycobacterium shinjukuense TaxID=398694 RepID=A0A7I7MMB6_9MYCO|nr:phospholipase C [Mycobacterium shinjukuense]MCV6984042.1 phospholipase C [Mycobacterium shinjukuense]BBX72952.1 phospholipase C 1 [Mycobacterium shinjukuense]
MSANPFVGMSRREFLAKLTGAGAAALLTDYAGPVIDKAYGAGPCPGHLTDIEHIVLLMQENRSFDHYFGTLSSTRGFNDPSPAFAQKGWNPMTQALDPAGTTIPFRLDTTRGPFLDGECVNDPEHQWAAMHRAWNGGANDNWLPAQAVTRAGPYVPMTMGYYTRQDIPIHYLLADTFTICDGYHCSLLTGTLPNRLYWLSAHIDPAGTNGGPQLVEPGFLPLQQYSWRIMPENLEEAGVSWKVYQAKDAGRFINTPISNNGLVQAFKQSADPRSNLARFGIAPSYPVDFAADVKGNRLPKVSWLVPPFIQSEHPALPVALGAVSMVTALRILLSNPAVWEKTALIISYDENGGFFDHVTPPTAPPGTPGEYVTVPDIDAVPGSGGIRGPLGLGFRVPCIVISPFSRGGLMVHDTFDHTSQLKLIRARFGVPVPNLTTWRDGVVGDLTSAFNFASPPNPGKPHLSHPLLAAVPKLPQCVPNVVLGSTDGVLPSIPYRVPFPQSMPNQETTPVRGIPSGLCS